jgi:hypothetical protein
MVFRRARDTNPLFGFNRTPILMEKPQPARGGTLASKSKNVNKRQFIQYEPDLVDELNDKKTKNQSVSGRLLTIIYNRLLFWSRYSKHLFEGRRYFWKSISELSIEISYSEKQVGRGLKALEELGMIKREKLNKHNWKHTYYYYLPHSVHTAEPTSYPSSTQRPTRRTSSNGMRLDSSNSTSASSEPVQPTSYPSSTQRPTRTPIRRSFKGIQPHSVGAGSPGGAEPQEEPVKPIRQRYSSQNVPFISKENNPLLTKQLRQIVEKCLDYSINPPKPLTTRGIGFAT